MIFGSGSAGLGIELSQSKPDCQREYSLEHNCLLTFSGPASLGWNWQTIGGLAGWVKRRYGRSGGIVEAES